MHPHVSPKLPGSGEPPLPVITQIASQVQKHTIKPSGTARNYSLGGMGPSFYQYDHSLDEFTHLSVKSPSFARPKASFESLFQGKHTISC
jgi:hypothetical protein